MNMAQELEERSEPDKFSLFSDSRILRLLGTAKPERREQRFDRESSVYIV
jgi:hypothetical protein